MLMPEWKAGGFPGSQPSASAPMASFNDKIDESYFGLDEVNLLWGQSTSTRVSPLLLSWCLVH